MQGQLPYHAFGPGSRRPVFRLGVHQMNLPLDHPRRQEFNDEVQARPPETLCAPLRLSYLALFAEGTQRQQGWDCVAARFGVEPPAGRTSQQNTTMALALSPLNRLGY